MAKNFRPANPKTALSGLMTLLDEFPETLERGTVGEQVCRLVEIHHRLRDLGVSIVAPLVKGDTDSGRARLLAYLRNQVGRIVHTDELMIVAAIGDYPRRIRELRGDFGWPVISGMAVRDMRVDARAVANPGDRLPGDMAPDEYLLLIDHQDLDAVRRWSLAVQMRNKPGILKEKLLNYLLQAVGMRVTAEELRHVGKDDAAWPEAIRSLQADGWDISREAGKATGVPPGLFILNSAVCGAEKR